MKEIGRIKYIIKTICIYTWKNISLFSKIKYFASNGEII